MSALYELRYDYENHRVVRLRLADADVPLSPRGETPEQILNRLAARLNCEPRQVCDRVIRILEERQNGKD